MRLIASCEAMPLRTKVASLRMFKPSTKILRLVFLLTIALQTSAKASAQSITLNANKTSLKSVLESIKKQSGYSLFYGEKLLLQKSSPVSVNVQNATLENALDLVFQTQPLLTYEIVANKIISIKERSTTPTTTKTDTENSIVAPIIVAGTIKNEMGELLDGATVNVKAGTQATTSINGKFEITVPNSKTVLVISYVGYESQEITVGAKTDLSVTLRKKTSSLDDMVVIGYASQSRRDLTGAVSSVNAAQLKDIPVNSALQALEGRLAGVNISTTEGGPNASVTIKVRGGGSITQDNTPLYIVDGIQMEDALSNVSPQDIASVDVLKDAASTAIYGARGANGVVIITTKSGKPMKTVVAYNYFYGINKLAKKFAVMNPKEFIEFNWEKTRRTLTDSVAFASQYGNTWEGLDSIRNKPNVDWQQLTFGRNAPTQTHNVSIAGGDRATTFNISYTNNNEKSIMINSSYNRNIFYMRFDHIVSNKFKVGANFIYNEQDIYGTGTSSSGAVTNNRLRNSVKYRPVLMNSTDPANAQDDIYFATTNVSGYYLIDPIQFSNASYRHNETRYLTLSGYLNYTFNDYFSLRVTGGTNKNNGQLNVFDDYITWNAITNSAGKPIINLSTSNTTSVNENAVLSFSNSKSQSSFSKNNVFTALVGQEIYQLSSNSQTDQVRYFPIGITEDKAFSQLSLGTSAPLYPTSSDTKSRITSFFSRIGYTFKNKYLATFNLRADGSSKFAPGHQWGYFPSGAVAWRISNEKFFKENSIASDLKLRVSVGLAGNNRINDFLYTSLYNSTSSPYTLNNTIIPGYSIPSLANPNLKWESTLSRNIGLDAGLFNNKVQVTFDAYMNDTRDLLINVPIAGNSGFTNQLQNVGSVQNRGWELQLSTVAIAKRNFKWNINFNISANHNEVKKLSNVSNHYFASSGWGAGNEFLVQVGQPIGTMWGYKADGMYTVNDFDYDPSTTAYTLKKGVPDNTASVGMPAPGTKKLKDLNGDGIVNTSDQTIIGNAQPKFTGGFNNQFIFKNFDLSVFVNFVYGNKILNGDKVEFSNSPAGAVTNLTAIMNKRWKTIDANGVAQQWTVVVNGKTLPGGVAPAVLTALNKNAKIWQPIKGGNYLELDSWAIEDGSFLRVNNVTLGYTLPLGSLLKSKINSLRVYCTVNNLAVLTKYTGLDPEVSTKNYNYVTPGVDSSPYPRSRAFIAGVNVKF